MNEQDLVKAGQQKVNAPQFNPLQNISLANIQGPQQLQMPTYQAGQNLQLGNLQGPGMLQMGNIKAPENFKYNPFNFKPVEAKGSLADSKNAYKYNPERISSTMAAENFTKDWFEKGVANPLMRQYDTAITPRINDAAASGGNTFSTRTQTAKANALTDLQTQMAAQLSTAAREDAYSKADQQFQAQQFNSQAGLQNAQFGAGQQLSYDQLNSQKALELAGLNTNASLTAGQMNQNAAQNAASLNSSNYLQTAGLNSQNQLTANQQNIQNALGFGQLNTDRALGAAQLNNQNQQYFAGLNSQNALQAGDLNLRNVLGMGQLNTDRTLGAANFNLQNQLGFGQLNSQNYLQSQGMNLQNQQFNNQLRTNMGNAALDRQLASVGALQQASNNPLQQMMMASQVAGPIQAQGNLQNQMQMQEAMRNMPENNPWLQMMMQYITRDSNPVVKPDQTGQYVQAGAGLASAVAMAAALSDVRLKTNIEKVGEYSDGLGRYQWNWKADPAGQRQEGVLAQEVGLLRPWAYMHDLVGGYSGVNYAAL